MTIEADIERLRRIFAEDPDNAGDRIENWIDRICDGFSPEEKADYIESLADRFAPGSLQQEKEGGMTVNEPLFAKLVELVLGPEYENVDFSSEMFLQSFSNALNRVFDILNELVGVINKTLLDDFDAEETIRHVIGSQVTGVEGRDSLDVYLGKVSRTFMVTHQAFKNAAQSVVGEILQELGPGRIAAASEKGLKFGPLKKAEYYEIYEKKFEKFRDWYDSGRFMNKFLREFELHCKKLSSK